MATDIGKVGIVMKGNWGSSATYEALDAVSYSNGLYIAKKAVPANTLPTNTSYWQEAINMDSFRPKSQTINIASNTTITLGIAEANDVVVPTNSTFYLSGCSSQHIVNSFFNTNAANVVGLADINAPVNFTLTVSSGILSITNQTAYSRALTLTIF